jgi:hypothetical protein
MMAAPAAKAKTSITIKVKSPAAMRPMVFLL